MAKDECDLVTEQGRWVVHATGESVHGRDGGGKVGRRSKVAKGEHCSVALEEWERCVEESLLELWDGGRLCGLCKRWCRVDGREVTIMQVSSAMYSSPILFIISIPYLSEGE